MGGLDARRVFRIKSRFDDFVLQGFEAFAGFGEGAVPVRRTASPLCFLYV